MTSITNLPSLASSNTASQTSTASNSLTNSRSGIANNFDQFLQLLTTQLKNQSPLDPLDTNQFTQQLVQFAGVEQQLRTNETLSTLVSANRVGNATSALGFVGANVTVDRNGSPMQDGKVKWLMNAPRAGTASITIKDKDGKTVHVGSKTLTAGEQEFVWDGKLPNGSQAAAGEYKISVSALDTVNKVMDVKPFMLARVDSVDVSGNIPRIKVGSLDLALTDVKTILRN
ncbi:MAG: flagellar hook assembly protein FlgD [Methylobacterium sp.]|nr:flagellar hook assembly protein FlgD [Methylobacterium sp.]MCA3596853.1 flagellar hook assembly protein FlgD [Methylobacterium sp.]MCA3602973.1 flagellar hook assembly protein FlgD [Methylobacterium sp.]MCA3607862.1 flagellar hook assembly protein FlgD [Methylobacterium sp.]MCA3610000.1 flagellar hook assembly protein FlgD [Methylobacterium sp.]